MNLLVFGVFVAVALSRLWTSDLTWGSGARVAVLVAVALLGYRYASSRRLSRTWGILAFLVSWYWIPPVGLVGLLTLGRLRGGHDRKSEDKPTAPAPAVGGTAPGGVGMTRVALEGGYGPESLALLLEVASEYQDAETEYGVGIRSPFGEHIVPLMVRTVKREFGIYADANPWTTASEERCLRWLGLLRTSELEDLEVEIRGEHGVHERLRYYSGLRRRVLFEVAAIPQVKWVDAEGFASENARRPAGESAHAPVERQAMESALGLPPCERQESGKCEGPP